MSELSSNAASGFRMEPALKAKWINALRSGEYEQTTATLEKMDNYGPAYCCLGVLCRIQGIAIPVSEQGTAYRAIIPQINPPQRGLFDSNSRTLMRMNDTERKSFPEIADWIEENL